MALDDDCSRKRFRAGHADLGCLAMLLNTEGPAVVYRVADKLQHITSWIHDRLGLGEKAPLREIVERHAHVASAISVTLIVPQSCSPRPRDHPCSDVAGVLRATTSH